jgi:membrane-associated phospholipid phosphatase
MRATALVALAVVVALAPAVARGESRAFDASLDPDAFVLTASLAELAQTPPPPGASQEGDPHTTPDAVPPAGPPPAHTGIKATLRGIPGDFKHMPTKSNLRTLAVGAGLALIAHPWDKGVNRHLDTGRTFWSPGQFIGQGALEIGGAVAVYAYGRAFKHPRASHLGMDLLRASIEVGVLTYAVKLTVRRDRPTGACCSLPSGHASVTFAVASTLWQHLSWRAAAPTYAVASYVALSRLHENVHWLSDVISGATLGLVVGRTVTRHGRDVWSLQPIAAPGGGIALAVVHGSGGHAR